MGDVKAEIRCPECNSERVSWTGIENDHHQPNHGIYGEAIRDPAAVIHKWECFECGNSFRQRLE